MDNKKRITHEGELNLGNTIIPCYVLEDGTRVLSSMNMQQALRMVEKSETGANTPSRLTEFLAQKSLEPYIYREKTPDDYNPIICYKGNQKINGFEANTLVDICDAFLEARKALKKLSYRQTIIADQCEILMRGFARVGLIALIDEATGYQYDRERFELEKIINAYVLKEKTKWKLTFELDFYREIFRLWGVPFTPANIRRKPRFIAKLTIKYVYKLLPPGVYERVKEVTPKNEKGEYKYRLHQNLTPEIGKEHQKKILQEVTTLASVSDTKDQFNTLIAKKYHEITEYEPLEQIEIDFTEESGQISLFEKNITTALEYSKRRAE